MVYHSHYLVTDKKTGVVHSLCCYKECNARIVTDDDVLEKKGNTLSTEYNNKIPLSKYKKDETISTFKSPTKNKNLNNKKDDDNDDDEDSEPFIRSKKPPQKEGPLFTLKLSSDIFKAYMKDKATSNYSSDDYFELTTDTESSKSSTKSVLKNFEKILIIDDDNDDKKNIENFSNTNNNTNNKKIVEKNLENIPLTVNKKKKKKSLEKIPTTVKKHFKKISTSVKKNSENIPTIVLLDSSEDENYDDENENDDDDDECMEIDEEEFSRTVHTDASLHNYNTLTLTSPIDNSNSGTDLRNTATATTGSSSMIDSLDSSYQPNNFNPDVESQQKSNTVPVPNNILIESLTSTYQADKVNHETDSQQKSNLENSSYHEATENARQALINLVRNFHLKYADEIVTSSLLSQGSIESVSDTSEENQENSKTQEGFVSNPVTISKSNVVSTDKIPFKDKKSEKSEKNEKKKNEKKSTRPRSQSLLTIGTSESPIDLDKDDNARSRIKQTNNVNNDDGIGESNPVVVVNSIQSHDNLMNLSSLTDLTMSGFREDFKKIGLNSCKRRFDLEFNDADSQHRKKSTKISKDQSSFQEYDGSQDSPTVQIPVFKNQNYLTLALTHSSVFSDRRNYIPNNNLETFGGCVMSIIITDMAHEMFGNELTKELYEQIHTNLCGNHRLCQFANMLKLKDLIYSGKPSLNVKEMANIFLALLTAIVVDCGWCVAVDFVEKLAGPIMNNLVKKGKFVGVKIVDTLFMNEKILIKNVIRLAPN